MPPSRRDGRKLAQLRGVFLKNFTLQSRQRVSLGFQVIPLLGFLIACIVLNARFPPAISVPRSYSNYVPPGTTPNWRTASSWNYFWYTDTTGKAGSLPHNGSLTPSFDGPLGFSSQFLYSDPYGWNRSGNVPFFTKKPDLSSLLSDFHDLTVQGDSLQGGYYYNCQAAPNYAAQIAFCNFSFSVPQTGFAFNKLDKDVNGYSIEYSAITFPNTYAFDNNQPYVMNQVTDAISVMDSVMLRWIGNFTTTTGSNKNMDAFVTNYKMFYWTYDFGMGDLNAMVQLMLWIIGISLLIPFFMGKLVIERGTGLMEVSRMAGLNPISYWGSIILQDLTQITAILFFLVCCGLASGWQLLFSGPLIYLAIFSFGVSIMCFSYLFSLIFKSIGWAYFIGYMMGLSIAALVLPLNFLYFGIGTLPSAYFLWIPPLSASRAIFVLAHAVVRPGLIPMHEAEATSAWCILWSFGFSAIFLFLSVLPDIIRETKEIMLNSGSKSRQAITETHPLISECSTVQLDEDVLHDTRIDCGDDEKPLLVEGLHKVFVSDTAGAEFQAVSNVSFHINQGECFGLLGPNGAGKTTLINMLVGITEPTSGRAFVNGHNILDDITGVQGSIGLCPQFDNHYDDLTVKEHLLYYSRLSGFNRSDEGAHVKQVIKEVGLVEEKHRKAGDLSGGQKRRLSIGIALCGDPPVVFLDEPSSGLDVGNQRGIWEIICVARKKRSFLITTHSMAEAEVLCSTIGIMSRGSLKYIGTPQYLKGKYGSGFKIDMIVDTSQIDSDKRATQFLKSLIPEAELVDVSAGFLTFQIPKNVKLSKVIAQIEIGKKANGIINWGLSQSNLQEVFLALTRNDEKDANLN